MVSTTRCGSEKLHGVTPWWNDLVCIEPDSRPDPDEWERNCKRASSITRLRGNSGKPFPSREPLWHARAECLESRGVDAVSHLRRAEQARRQRRSSSGRSVRSVPSGGTSNLPDWTLSPAETAEHAEMWEKGGHWKRLCDASVRVARRLNEYESAARLADKEVADHLVKYQRLRRSAEEVDAVRRAYRVGASRRLSEIEGFSSALRCLLVNLAAICTVNPEAALGVVARGFHNAFIDILNASQKRPLVAGAAAEAIASLLWLAPNRKLLVGNRQLIIGLCALLIRCRKQDASREDEMLTYIGSLMARAGKTPMDLFGALDANRDGRLERKEIDQLLLTLEPKLKSEQLAMVFEKIDTDGDGALSLQELCLALRPASSIIVRINSSLSFLRKTPKELFKSFDASKDGKLNQKEMNEMLLQVVPEMSPEELIALFAFFDRDGDGTVSVRELSEALDEEGAAARACLRCLAGLASGGKMTTSLLMEMEVLENAVGLMEDRANARMDADLCARLCELCTHMLSNISDPGKQSEFVSKDSIEWAYQVMNQHDRSAEVVGWGLALIHTALEYQDIRPDVKNLVPTVDKFETLHGDTPHVAKLAEKVATQLASRDY